MKTIKNETFSVKIASDAEQLATTASMLRLTLNKSPDSGFDYKTIRLRLKIEEALDKATDSIALEDAQYEEAKRCVACYRWPIRHVDIAKFAEQFES